MKKDQGHASDSGFKDNDNTMKQEETGNAGEQRPSQRPANDKKLKTGRRARPLL